jgi:hypothetical protein
MNQEEAPARKGELCYNDDMMLEDYDDDDEAVVDDNVYKHEEVTHFCNTNGLSSASVALNSSEGLHHPEITSFMRDQAGFIISPRKRSLLFSPCSAALQNGSSSAHATTTATDDSSPLSAVEVALSIVEEPVALAPRFSQPLEGTEEEHFHQGGVMTHLNRHFLSSSRSVLGANESARTASGANIWEPKSPTSTTARDFLREIPCPSIPIQSIGSNSSTVGSTVMQLGRSFSMDQSDSSNCARARHSTSQRFLHRSNGEENVNDPTRPSSAGRALCRSFAWSHDSQDDLRSTKRARMGNGTHSNYNNNNYPLLPNSTQNVLFVTPPPASVPQQQDNLQFSSSHFLEEEEVEEEHRDDLTFSPTMVHWEEKVGDGDELLARASRHHQQRWQQQQQRQEGFRQQHHPPLVGFVTRLELSISGGLPPPIVPAASASQYSFDSGP